MFKNFGGGNMQNLMRQAQKMQEGMQTKLKEADEKLEETIITTTAGGGMVEVNITGNKKITSLKLNKEVVDPDDVEMLEDLIIASVNDAIEKAVNLEKELKDGIHGGMF